MQRFFINHKHFIIQNKTVNMKRIIIIATVLAFSATTFAQTWSVDKAHSRLEFSIMHLSIADLGGTIKGIDSKITSSKDDFSDAVIEFSADINSINTDNEQRDTHLKSPDFFDAAKFPAITFKSKSFTKVSGKQYKLAGDLTLHGVTKPVVLDVVYNGSAIHPQSKKTIAGFKITGTVKRTDFGIAAAMPPAMLGDDVAIVANTEFSKD
jgi:polyisoprenoid-binding protein YceI